MTRVLIVDDERNIHKAYCADIQAAADRYELVDTIVSAADAIMVCTAKHIDLVLMDINTAKNENGIEAKKRIKKSCPGCGKIITSELEAVVYQQMVKKLEKHKTLTGRKKAAKANPKIAALQVELLHVDSEIEKLVDSLTGANNVLLSYVNVKIAELDGRKQELVKQIAELTVETISPGQVNQISGYLDTWDDVSFDDKRRVVDLMITTVAATSDSLNITWKI